MNIEKLKKIIREQVQTLREGKLCPEGMTWVWGNTDGSAGGSCQYPNQLPTVTVHGKHGNDDFTNSEIDLKEAEECNNWTACPTCGPGCNPECVDGKCVDCPGPDCPEDDVEDERVAGGGTKRTVKTRKPSQDNFMKENKTIKNKMEKKVINERFQELAGIKPLYKESNESNEDKSLTKEDLLNEGPELWTALGGLVGLIGAAGITAQLQMMAEDPIMAEKYPKLEKVFSFLAKVGGAVGAGIK